MNFDLHRAIEVLERTPTVVRTLLAGLNDEWIRGNEGPETFSAFDVVGHLIQGERTDWLQRLERILIDGERRAFDPFDRFSQATASAGKTLEALLDEFSRLRAANLTRLRVLELDAA